MKKFNIDPLSYTTIPISMHFGETKLANGTAFVYEFKKKYYLITNWHNVTGINPITKKPIGNNAGIPDAIEFYLLIQKEPFLKWGKFKLHLYEENKAKWFTHPTHKENVDVVAIELEIPNDFIGIIQPINNIKFDALKLEIADDIFILGYPYSFNGGGKFPIWKRGSVATEPDIDYENLPKIFVDTASKSGMSGSPVIFRRDGIHGAINNILTADTILGEIQGFVGIYSGRITGDSDLDAQLGIVWKAEVIEEIIKGNMKDEKTFY